MALPIDPTATGFLLGESRTMPMHVGSLQLYRKPEGAGRTYARDLYQQMRADSANIAPLFLKRPHRSLATAGQYTWVPDEQFDIEHHLRHSALPKPGRIRELLDLCSRLHGTRLAHERPLWEAHVIEGLRDGRVAIYSKMHHALVDGISAMRLLQRVLSDDPDERGMLPPWAARPPRENPVEEHADRGLVEVSTNVLRTALGISAEAAGMPGAFIKTVRRAARNEASPIAFNPPRTILNQNITGARRFAAQDWPIERLKAIGKASDTTLNDVVLAMSGGAIRRYLLELNELPPEPLVAMVPIGLKAKESHLPSAEGGNAVGMVIAQLGTHLEDPAARLTSISDSMRSGKEALATMTPAQIVAMSAIGMSPAILLPILGARGSLRPPFNLIISNVPGPKTTQYFNGARLDGMYPLSIPTHGVALNITCVSYADDLCFGLTGCRRTVPHLQRLLTYLDEEIVALEKAAGV
jgi:diacylglycerol O-acyltransferase